MLRKIVVLIVIGFSWYCLSNAQTKENKVEVVASFEDEADVDLWTADDGAEIIGEHNTEGAKSLKVEYKADETKEKRCCIEGKKFESLFPSDWRIYKSIKIDVFNKSDKEGLLQVRIKSDEHQKIWSKAFKIPANKPYTIEITTDELKTKINLDNVMYLGFTMGKNQYLTDMKPLDSNFTLYFDNIRFVK